ncbi:MAG: sigma 54-interacting transcriptional regulator, partial [Acidobacteria bacterium]|nr:sigma 54-interacting transcriptional regulator [Acidobacteriota bacterium]
IVHDGPHESSGSSAVPIYVNGALNGVISLEGTDPGALTTLTAISSLASVAIESVREIEELRREYIALERRLVQRNTGGILGQSPAILKLLDRIEKLAPRETTVLIQGESGTGKELVARLLHAASPRATAPFAAINCAAIAADLLESELFGHEKGAFTGAVALKKGKIEAADGGTLFLDEIGELALPLQAKLLRVLQEREFERVGSTRSLKVDLRIVAATNRDLVEEARRSQFRQDLYHRLNVVSLRTPPLRERPSDIPLLAQHFLALSSDSARRSNLTLSSETVRALEAYDWPGNVRELENAIEHAVVLAEGPVIHPTDLPEHLWPTTQRATVGVFQDTVTDAKRDSILRAYEQAQGDYKAAAKILGIHPNYLLRLVRNLGLREAIRK